MIEMIEIEIRERDREIFPSELEGPLLPLFGRIRIIRYFLNACKTKVTYENPKQDNKTY